MGFVKLVLPSINFVPKNRNLYLESFGLVHFKNYEQARLTCSAQLNCFVGRNGMGKTNLLEAIYYLCMGKSHTSLSDQYLTRHGADFFRLEAQFSTDDARRDRVVIKVKARQRKEILPTEEKKGKIGKNRAK